jgi:ComF family protein
MADADRLFGHVDCPLAWSGNRGDGGMKYVERVRACQSDWGSLLDQWADRILPRRCLVCSLGCGPEGICVDCLRDLPWNRSPCQRCGLPLPGGVGGTCGACLLRPPPFHYVVSPLLYRFPVRQLIRQFKFRRNFAAGAALTGLLGRHLLANGTDPPDCLVPVPMHGARLLFRGFNQAHDIARQLGRTSGTPLLDHDLRRPRRTRAQTGLDAIERRRNLRGAFAWHGRVLAGKHVALVDDVMTTGTTVGECTRVLRKAGAERVDIWVLARAARAT